MCWKSERRKEEQRRREEGEDALNQSRPRFAQTCKLLHSQKSRKASQQKSRTVPVWNLAFRDDKQRAATKQRKKNTGWWNRFASFMVYQCEIHPCFLLLSTIRQRKRESLRLFHGLPGRVSSCLSSARLSGFTNAQFKFAHENLIGKRKEGVQKQELRDIWLGFIKDDQQQRIHFDFSFPLALLFGASHQQSLPKFHTASRLSSFHSIISSSFSPYHSTHSRNRIRRVDGK